MISRTDRAWAAGFFDGEGNCCCILRKKPYGTYPEIALQIVQKDHRVLDKWFDTFDGIGNAHFRERIEIYAWSNSSFEHVQMIMILMWEFLSEAKREQYIKQVTKYLQSRSKNKTKRKGSNASTKWKFTGIE